MFTSNSQRLFSESREQLCNCQGQICNNESLKTGDILGGFEVLATENIEDVSSTGIYLKHKKTGLEVFHLFNDDSENLFAFSFATPSLSPSGIAHVMEHSVLCGSEKYPLKDPFLCIENQCIKTYLNALTMSDRTVYPASSQVKRDYFKILDVYSDAVFFPLLRKETFLQECRRVEISDSGEKTIQGVVYNEMKGATSAFSSVVNNVVMQSLFGGTAYENIAGGNPLDIARLSYEEFLDFHHTYYRPSNCRLFLYGNIPTVEQLDFLQENLLNRLEAKIEDDKSFACPVVDLRESPEPVLTKEVFATGPAGESSDNLSTVAFSWLFDKKNQDMTLENKIELLFLDVLLSGTDYAPLVKPLKDANLIQDVSSVSGGTFGHTLFSYSTLAFRGVKKDDVSKIRDMIFSSLADVCKNGIAEEQIRGILYSCEFSFREVSRNMGPDSLDTMRKVFDAWLYGKEPWANLHFNAALSALNRKVLGSPDYVKSLVQKYFVDNPRFTTVVVTPSEDYNRKEKEAELALCSSLCEKSTPEKLQAELASLRAFQSTKDSSALLSLIPHTPTAELSAEADDITLTQEGNVLISKEKTNGIVYFSVSYPLDVLSASDYPLVPFFAWTAVNCGWGDLSWSEAEVKKNELTGFFYCGARSIDPPPFTNPPAELNRDWLNFTIAFLPDLCEEAFNLLADCINNLDFRDTEKLSDIAVEFRNHVGEAMAYSGHRFAAVRSSMRACHSQIVAELWNGLSVVECSKKLVGADMNEMASRFRSMLSSLKEAGGIVHITSDEEGLERAKKPLEDFIKKINLKKVNDKKAIKDSELLALIDAKEGDESFSVPSQMGAAAISCKIKDVENAQSYVALSHYMDSGEVWEKFRNAGGAYGANTNFQSATSVFSMTTYRDPKPFASIEVFRSCLESIIENPPSKEEVERCITGAYSDKVEPSSPADRGSTAVLRLCSGITKEYERNEMKSLLSVTSEKLVAAAKNLLDLLPSAKTVVAAPAL